MILESLQSRVPKLMEEVDQIAKAKYSYQYNVKLLGVPQQETNETSYQCAKLCLNIFHEIGADDISLQDIDIAHSVPSRAGEETKPTVCKFARRLAKDQVMRFQERNQYD